MSQYLINSLADMKSTIKELIKHPRLAHDTETKGPDNAPDISGLYPFHGARSFSHIFATQEDEFYFDFNTGGINPKYKPDLQEIFEDPTRAYYYVHSVFDNTVMHFDGLKNKGRLIDIPAIARVEFNEHGKQSWMDEEFLSMKYLAEYYQVKLKDSRVEEYIAQNRLYSSKRCRFTNEEIPLYNLVPLDLMFPYGCGDGRTTFDLGLAVAKCINYKDEIYAHQRKDAGLMINVAQNEIKLQSVLVEMKIEGFPVWTEYVKKAIAYEKGNLESLTSEVRHLLPKDMNLNSGKQLADFLNSKGIELPRMEPTDTAIKRAGAWSEKAEIARVSGNTKKYFEYKKKAEDYAKGNQSTDKKTLAALLAKNPQLDFLAKITAAKECEKKIGTYYENFILLADENGVIHCGLNAEKAKTGRFSSSDPNLQNIEKTPAVKEWAVRKAFWCPEEDFDLFFLDFDQQEMIVMLDQAGELPVISKLLSGEFEDFYLATMAVIKEITGMVITRQQAKAIALGLAYGQGDELLAENLNLTIEKARELKNAFFTALPSLKAFRKSLENQCKWYGKIHNPFGRVSYIDKNGAYKALNSFVQGTSADITKTAMVSISAFIKDNKLKSKMLLCVHDELIFKVHISERWIIPELQRLMSEAYPYKHIPLSTGVEWSPRSWGEKMPYNPVA